MTKRYNISKPRKYISNGVEKTYWDKVGEMVEFEKQDGSVSRIVKIPAIGLEANVFEDRPKAEPAPVARPAAPADIVYPDEEINPEDIPF